MGVNLIKNGGFEEGLKDWEIMYGTPSIVVEDGRTCVKFEGLGHSLRQRDIYLEAAKWYASFKYKTLGDLFDFEIYEEGTWNNLLRVRLGEYDTPGKDIGNGWREVLVTFAYEGRVRIDMMQCGSGAGKFFIDDVYLGTQPPSEDLEFLGAIAILTVLAVTGILGYVYREQILKFLGFQ